MLSILRQIAFLKSVRCGGSSRSVQGMRGIGRLWFVGVIPLLLVVMTGCGSSSTSGAGAKATPITMTNASGLTAPASVLSIGSQLSFSMMPSNDVNNLGVDWTVICGGSPTTGSVTNGACGTLSPAHTQNGGSTVYTAPSQVPVNTSITITATVTSNRAQSSNVSLTIVVEPIGVSFETGSVIPASLVINATQGLNAQVTNDPLGAGVIWTVTCGSTSACGSFNPAVSNAPSAVEYFTTYTAPSAVPVGGTVTITATSLTDTTKSISDTLTITAEPPPVTVSVLPSNVYLETSGSTHSVSLTAIVTNDLALAGVDWTLSCGVSNCGTFSGSTKVHTASGVAVDYVSPSTAPPSQTVTIKATSTTNPGVSASATANIVTTLPIIVAISSAPPTALTAGTQATLVAKVTNDTANLGVNWTATCGSAVACGSFSLSAHTASGGQIVYTAPASVPSGGVVTITASSPATTPSNSAVAFTTILAQSPSLTFSEIPSASIPMVSLTQAPVSATVANDVAPGGVTWSAQCSNTAPGGCGWFVPVQTASGATTMYTAPPVTSTGTSVTIVATSVADPSISINSNPITISPQTVRSVGFIPSLPAQIQPNATVNLNAAVANDTTSAGVDWNVCASGCGFFTIKPATPAIAATATTPPVPAVPAVTSTTTNTQLSPYWPNGWPSGLPLPYTAPSEVPASGLVAVAASSHADTTKAISGTIAVTTNSTGPALNGVVQVGTQPVAGASVFLYAAGTSGYASASSQLAAVTAGKNGNFTIPAGYTCPSPSSQTYLVATGGQVGTNAANPNLSLMTALGSCNALGSSTVVINELTSVASAWSISPFAANDALTGNGSYLYLGTSSGNLSGLANAFAAVNNLVDITTGQPRFWTPAGNAVVPFVQINTLANFLNACAATSGGIEGDGSPCSVLFTAADTLGTGIFAGSIAPSDTLQAAFNIAQHPSTPIPSGPGDGNYDVDRATNLHTLATSASPFQPILTANPVQDEISLSYTSGGGLTAASTVGSFAVDASGNLWITDTTGGDVIEWNATGAALTPSTGFPAGGGLLAIDANGNIWVSGNGVLSELTSLGAPVPGSPYGGVAGGGNDIAIDAQGDLWIANGGGVSEFNNFGVELSPASGFTNSAISGTATAVGIDSSNNVWIQNAITGEVVSSLSELTNPGGALIVSVGVPTASPELAANGSGDIWAVSPGDVFKLPPYGGLSTILVPTLYATGIASGGNGSTPFGADSQGVAFDGAGGVWVASPGGNVTLLDELGNYSGAQTSAPLSDGLSLRAAVDGSGNVWVLLTNNAVVEHIGAATPVVTPIALGAKNKKLAAKP
jgi:hypothetical protein